MSAGFAGRVVAWQRTHGRHALPWQRTREPYRVWLSEIMLQQTQVATVLPYYERFLQRFPDVTALAAAPPDEVLALWAGLGYYSRARNLHRCAQVVLAEHGGEFPRQAAALAALPGIGRSTAAAIAAFCFGERSAILDGNVKRVLGRAFGVTDDLAVARHERALWARAEALLPESADDMAAYTQGLMDLGATVCTRRAPRCADCPLREGCVARAEGRPEAYPVRTRRLRRSARRVVLLWASHAGRVWLVRRPDTGIWAGLWSLPDFDSPEALAEATAGWPGGAHWLPGLTHVLTHRDLYLEPARWALPEAAQAASLPAGAWPQGRWVAREELPAYGLPAPVARLLAGADGGEAAEPGNADDADDFDGGR